MLQLTPLEQLAATQPLSSPFTTCTPCCATTPHSTPPHRCSASSHPSPPLPSTLCTRCVELEKQLKALQRKKSFHEPEVRALRASLGAAYEEMLLADYKGAQAREVEQALWKSMCYRWGVWRAGPGA